MKLDPIKTTVYAAFTISYGYAIIYSQQGVAGMMFAAAIVAAILINVYDKEIK